MSCGTSTTLTRQALEMYTLLGFKELTEIQRNALRPLLESELDVLLIAPTGSGKTEAALIPLIVRIIMNRQVKGVKLLYITPLRALNRDILERITKIAARVGLSVDVWHGDTPHERRKRIREHPPDILITTPESLQYLLINERIVEHFRTLYAIIIDEVQELVENERGAELVCALERLDYRLGRHVRRIALSAAVGDENTIAQYIFSKRPYIVVRSYVQKQYDIKVISYDISHTITKPSEFLLAIPIVVSVLKDILENHRQALLFVNTRITAEALAYYLSKALQSGTIQGINIAVHHASLSRAVREEVERSLRQRILNLVIATSSLEMGIDIGSIDIVLHLYSPRQAKRLAQRVGRAGHRWNTISKGIIITPPLVTEIFESLTLARRTVERDYEPLTEKIAPLDVLAHQIVGIALEYGKVGIDTLLNILRRAPPFSELSVHELEEVIEFLCSLNLIKRYNEYIEATSRGKLYYLTTTPIVESKHYIAKSIIDGRVVGVLDEEFVATCNEGDILVLGGNVWRLVSLDLDKEEILLEPVTNPSEIKIPHWVGENIPVDWRVARETCSLIRRFCTLDEAKAVQVLKRYFADDKLIEYLLSIRKEVCRVYPRDNEFVIEIVKGNANVLAAFYHCQGSKVSETLSLLLTRLFRKSGEKVYGYKSHQLASVLLLGQTLGINTIRKVIADLARLGKDEIVKILEDELKETPIFKWRLLAVAKKLGMISKDASLRELKKHAEALRNVNIVVKEALRELISERLDIDTTMNLLDKIKSRHIRVKVYVANKPSRYLTEILSLTPFIELRTATSVIDDIIRESIKRRLLEREITLFCLSCLNSWNTKLSSLLKDTIDELNAIHISKHKISCPICGSQTLTLINNRDEIPVLRSALNKLKKGLRDPSQYTDDERRILKRAQTIANLIMDYGVFALIALQGKGVGPETAKRILARASTFNDLIKLIYESEKEFLRTYHYWNRTSK
ncbi:MAG TPA: DEAD/DEAH box helicase [Ignisphaera sp.]|uniref:DEAD/DEAH box helicase n=1 Tax=Ignisphaera aggregans TaxID=334771 RepID=A0A833DUY3_9CREN|nr:DEAD/DEAH box helicase [Ignisphaera sp.]HIP56920.1 DEAD/DEAH box helicase [Ignisphaera aggregans]